MTLEKPLNMLISLLLLLSPYTGYHLKQIQTIGYMQPFIRVFPFTHLSRLTSGNAKHCARHWLHPHSPLDSLITPEK